MAQWLRAVAALPEDLGFELPTGQVTTICNSVPDDLEPLLASMGIMHIYGAQTHKQVKHPYTTNKKKSSADHGGKYLCIPAQRR